jgi:hypothetical protein
LYDINKATIIYSPNSKPRLMKKTLLLFVFTVQLFSQTPIQEFKFDGDRSNVENSNSFLGVAKFVDDRAGVAKSALRVDNTVLEITILNLPLSNTPRTVSVWVKYNDVSIANYIWGYGDFFNAQYFGLIQQSATNAKSDLNLASWGPTNDAVVSTSIAVNTWYNYTVTYDGLTSKIYRNGELIRSSLSPRKITSGNIFTIGAMAKKVSINADIDDLKIYDVALSSAEVAKLYDSSSFLAPNETVIAKTNATTVEYDAGLKSGKSNKVNSVAKQEIVLSNPIETAVIKSSEIFSTKGQKVLLSNKNVIDISSLPQGTYLLKVTSSSENSNAKQLTIK